MLDHHLQRAIVYQLAFINQARFSDLKPAEVENKLFTYHLKKTISAGFVEKLPSGLYQLTPVGRRLGIETLKSDQYLLDRAYSILLLLVRRRADGAWLLYARKKQPLLGFKGFAQAKPNANLDSLAVAKKSLQQNTNLVGDFSFAGAGYMHIFKAEELESFINFSLLACQDVTGDLAQNDEFGTYEWVKNPDFSARDMLPSMAELVKQYKPGKLFFIDKTFYLD